MTSPRLTWRRRSPAKAHKLQIQLQFAIAGSFADPKSKVYDAREAAKWYELASESGEAWAMLSLAFLYQEAASAIPTRKMLQLVQESRGEGTP